MATLPRFRTLVGLALLTSALGLSACAGKATGPTTASSSDFTYCVPFAREVSGVQIRGDAKTWWSQAATRYDRGAQPAKGAVLVLRSDSKLPSGHVAVVSAVRNDREILVDHANWGWNSKTRGRVYYAMPAQDVSPNNDWSQVRFKHPEVGDFGRPYPAHGFIYNSVNVASRD